jgi:serine protease
MKIKSPTYCAITQLIITTALGLSGCGGGGTDSSPNNPPVANPGTPVSYTITGKVAVADTAAVDADTNDPEATYFNNDDFDNAQAINNPTLVLGHLTLKDQGAKGRNSDFGDLSDVYKTKLVAGQVIELEFAANPADIDIDLVVFNASKKLVGQSSGENRYECVKITTTGDYFISAQVYEPTSAGDTTYQLRISPPGTSGQCSNATADSGPNIVPKAVITVAKNNHDSHVSLKSASVPRGAIVTINQAHLAAKSISVKSLVRQKLTVQNGYQIADSLAIDDDSREILRTIAHAKALRASGEYLAVSTDAYMTRFQTTPIVGTLPSNDPLYSRQQWHYDMISLPAAMATLNTQTPRPTKRPIVAVLDDGIMINHPDLASNIVSGYDFVSSPAANAGGDGDGIDPNPDDPSPGTLPVPASFHGTHTAGTVGAVGFNGIGGTGVAPMAKIMPVRVFGVDSGKFSDFMQGMLFAAGLPNDSGTVPTQRADIISMSLGLKTPQACNSNLPEKIIMDRVRAAGVVIVVAAGNESSVNLTDVSFPGNCDGVIAVGAVNNKRERSYYSNVGPTLSIAAPGGDTRDDPQGGIFSTVATWENGVRKPAMAYYQGTSMAAPHVAGVLALMKWANPALTGAQLENLIRSGAISEDLGDPGKDNSFGVGLINAKKAVDAAIAAIAAPGVPAPPVVAGKIEVSPTAIPFGAVRTEYDIVIKRVGASNDKVTSVVSSNPVVTIKPKAGQVDANGLGTYTATLNRTGLSLGPLAPTQITFNTTTAPVTVQVSAERRAGENTGSMGPIYVLIIDADSVNGTIIAEQVIKAPSGGVYNYSITLSGTSNAPPAKNIQVFAGTDLDNDGYICARGEGCGAYPIVDTSVETLPLTRNYTGIDFSAAPYGGIGVASVGSDSNQNTSGIRRKNGSVVYIPNEAAKLGFKKQ